MNECCEGQKTAYCPECGANLKKRSLLGLVEDLDRRLQKAGETRKKWARAVTVDGDELGATKRLRGLARAEETLQRLTCWQEELRGKMYE